MSKPTVGLIGTGIMGEPMARNLLKAGYKVAQSRIDEGLSYLSYDGKRPDDSEDYYDPMGNLGNQAFALYVRAMLGSKDT
ncbi:MAG: hypothetical protein IID43_02550, partial [Planctomycetes bacterium]|nr:hypothetical protein [Planctomycetota bacterium]